MAQAVSCGISLAGDATHDALFLGVKVMEFSPVPGLESCGKILLQIWDTMQQVAVSPFSAGVTMPTRAAEPWKKTNNLAQSHAMPPPGYACCRSHDFHTRGNLQAGRCRWKGITPSFEHL